MPSSTDNPQSTILTLHDAITDSPVYRSTSLHFDNQVDLLEKWLESLSKKIKSYVDKLNKFNFETNVLCKQVIPVGIDDAMIDPNVTGAIIKSFSDALQTSLAFKTKLVSDLEENFIQPLSIFIKTHLKEYKDFRKQHEKILEKYEAQLVKYTSQSKSKEASAVREEAFRLYEARKSYVRMSSQHVIRIIHFRSMVEHFLVERFTLATALHLKEFEGDAKPWSKLQSNLISWKQWLIDDKETCNFQLNQLQQSRSTLEKKFLATCRPVRDLEKYNMNTSQSNLNSRQNVDYSTTMNRHPSQKWGFLFVRGSRNYWTRRWFFLYDGCFGSCTISARSKGTVTLYDRISVLLCDIKPMPDVERRNCFEVMCAQQPPLLLQAETQVEMSEWIASFEKSKQLMLQTENIASEETPITEALSSPDVSQQKPSIVMLSSTPKHDHKSLSQSTSMTPLLVWEASREPSHAGASSSPSTKSSSQAALSLDEALPDDQETTSSTTTSTWGIPWALVPSMLQGGSSEDITSELPPTSGSSNVSAVMDADGHQIVWPTQVDDSNVKVDLSGYMSKLDSSNCKLRHLFDGVNPNEVVLFDFVGLLKKKTTDQEEDVDEIEAPVSPTLTNQSVDTMEQELSSQLPSPIKEPSSSYGFGYTGQAFVTQDTFWFYSCVLMHCVNTVAVRLSDIKSVHIIRDTSGLALAIDILNTKPSLIITPLMENTEVLAERLKFAVSNTQNPETLQTTYNTIHGLKSKSLPRSARSATDPMSTTSSGNNSTTGPDTPLPTSKFADVKNKLVSKTTRKYSAPIQPKSDAFTPTVMTAPVTGGFNTKTAGQEELPSPQSIENAPTKENVPSSPVSCDCDDHLDKLETEIQVPISAKHLFHLLFDETNPAYMDLWERKTVENKCRALTMTSWQTVDGKHERTLKYIMPVNNAMVKLKEAQVVEKQSIEKNQDHLCYVVLTWTKTAQLPYADDFVPYVKYCITRVAHNRCKLSCYTGVTFLKNILVEGMVTKATMKGMAENLAVFMPIIQQAANEYTKKETNESEPAHVVIETKNVKESAWYTSCVTFVQNLPSPVKIIGVVVLCLWLMFSWLRSGSQKQYAPSNPQKLNESLISRAVYLRDIDEGLFHIEYQPSYVQSESFRCFMDSKSTNRTLNVNHKWFSSYHHQLSIDLLFSRERLAMLRHNALVLFQLVNKVDAQLLENEYTNWLMDTRLQCSSPNVDYTGLHCDEVKRQLNTFPAVNK